MKRILLLLFISCGMLVHAQVYNNEWIDYNKTYYKFKVAATGLYRISQPSLASLGIGNTPAQQFQLWRNGTQVPLYTSVVNGALGGSDYIEFWGEMNDGKPDNPLYRQTDYQLNDKWSLETDTAVYFLTVNQGGTNLRLTATTNNVAGNSLAPEPYFTHTIGKYYKDRQNPGFAVNVGDLLFSSSYDMGEGWSSTEVAAGATATVTFPNLFASLVGGQPRLKVNISGNAENQRNVNISLNGSLILSPAVDFFGLQKTDNLIPLASLATNTATITVSNLGTSPFVASDRMVVHKVELVYPRLFNFGGEKNFAFDLPANNNGNFLQISGFDYGTTAPVLYDLTNGKRYVADISAAPLVKIALQGSSVYRKLVLVSQDASNINAVTSFNTRNFVNYTAVANQGDYLIISNPLLYTGANSVEGYRAYRSSTAGGSYKAKIYDVDQLVDQFGFGIKKSPLALRNFIFYAKNNYQSSVKFVFLIGKGVNYAAARANESNPDLDKLNLVPTFGQPASDNLLTSNPGSSQPVIPIGRLSAINDAEVNVYLKKVKEFELAQAVSSPASATKAWMKNVVHIVGADDGSLHDILTAYIDKYTTMISDTLFGANVTTFNKTTAGNSDQSTNSKLQQLFSDGISLITYFGHSSSSTLEFNLNSPENYNNQGKYPMFIALGCNAGNFYNFNTARFSAKESLSEKYVMSPDRGTIGFIASTHFGIVHSLDIYNTMMYNALGVTKYGKSMGEIINEAVKQVFNLTTEDDFYSRTNSEESALQGDPAITLNPFAKPDYVVEDSFVKTSPSFISIAETSFTMKAKFLNIGRAVNKNIAVQVKRTYPGGLTEVIYKDTIPGIRFADSISISIPIIPIRDSGLNKIIVTIDADNKVDELFETNNSITRDIVISTDETRPVYPYAFAIINKQNIKLIASTANPFSALKSYKMEMDTTESFNSPFKVTRTLSSTGGVLEFDPATTFTDSTVYYWRVASVPASGPMTWSSSSFTYLPTSDVGYNQSHFFQQLKSTSKRLTLDPSSRQWKYDSITNNFFIIGATFPTATTQDADNTIAVNDVAFIGPGCRSNEMIVNVFDPVTLKAWKNSYSGGTGLYSSVSSTCGSRREYNFEYTLGTVADRKKLMDFLDIIPTGFYVTIRSNIDPNVAGNTYASGWKADEAIYGPGISLYHKLLGQGFTDIDNFDKPRTWSFVFRKNDAASFQPKSSFSEGIFDKLVFSVDPQSIDSVGTITSPVFGPAKSWKQLRWRGNSSDANDGDRPLVNVIGVQADGGEDTLYRNLGANNQNYDISAIKTSDYPFIKLSMRNMDSVNHTPYQLRYWRLTYVAAPEGALAANLFSQIRDTIPVGDTLKFKVAFKNTSEVKFDSIKVKVIYTDRNNVQHVVSIPKLRPLNAGDTAHIYVRIDTKDLAGSNSLYIDVNPDNDQPEQYHFNNFAYRRFFVGAASSPLPVTLLSFTATKQASNVKLSWSTSQEMNSKNFVVERSQDGSNYTSIGVVGAAGNSSVTLNYDWIDNNPYKGVNFYRLKQVDLDDKSKYSNVQKVSFTKNIVISVSPNPATDFVNVSLDGITNTKASFRISDMTGKIVKQQSNTVINNQPVVVKLNGLSKGMYILQVITETDNWKEKIIVQ